MSDEAKQALVRLDDRIAALRQALEDSDWDQLAELNRNVRNLVDPVMTALEKRELDLQAVRQRLAELDRFVSDADASARRAREEAREALEQAGQNRKAANAYANVSNRNK